MAKATPKATEASRTGRGTAGPAAGSEVILGPAFSRKNYVLFVIALTVIALGFVLLARGSITLAPILLVTGYLVLVPLAIMKR